MEQLLQVPELALGASPGQMAVLQRGDACGIIAAIFKSFERIDHRRSDRLASQDSNDSAHEI
jgi:hypothetical protein